MSSHRRLSNAIRGLKEKFNSQIGGRNASPPWILFLSDELMQLILSFLDQASLARMSSVCHLLHAISNPLLYHSVTLDLWQGLKFAGSLEDNATLVQLVKSVAIHDHYVQFPDLHTEYATYTALLSRSIARLSGLRKLTVKSCYNHDVFRARAHTDDLLEFVQQTSLVFDSFFLEALQPWHLTKLRTCELNLSDSELWDFGERECILFHPTLRTLSIVGASISDIQSFRPTQTHITQLEELNLLCCDLSSQTLGKILAIPKSLRRFTYKGAPRVTAKAKHTVIVYEEYFDALQQHAHSLRALDISFWNCQYFRNPAVDLRGFGALEEVTIKPGVLQGNRGDCHDLTPLTGNPFPPSLKSLTLFDSKHALDKLLEARYVSVLSRWFNDGDLPNMGCLTFATPALEDYQLEQIPGSWTVAFRGNVVVQRQDLVTVNYFPFDCDCCEYNLGAWSLRF
ncbi:hypothetical protein BJX99DRAFT_257245 [Aspergillus californicus]